MPPGLSAALAALAVEAGPGEFTAAERLVGGSFSGLAGIRRDPDAKIDAAGLTSDEIGDWLLALPVGQGAELHIAWTADRLGARMSFEMFAANIGDLWFPRWTILSAWCSPAAALCSWSLIMRNSSRSLTCPVAFPSRLAACTGWKAVRAGVEQQSVRDEDFDLRPVSRGPGAEVLGLASWYLVLLAAALSFPTVEPMTTTLPDPDPGTAGRGPADQRR
jgi:hypothetical protein